MALNQHFRNILSFCEDNFVNLWSYKAGKTSLDTQYELMATNNHASIRYRVLDCCLKQQDVKYTMPVLLKKCNDAVGEFDPSSCEVGVRTFRKDIKYLKEVARESDVDINIKLGPDGYYYQYSDSEFSIYRNQLSETEMSQLKETIQMLGRFKGMPQFEEMGELMTKLEDKFELRGYEGHVIGYDQNENYVGSEILSDVFNYTVNKQAVRILYSPFTGADREWIFHPYFIKEYNNRWFLFGYNETDGYITNAALDRIRDIQLAGRKFIPNNQVDFDTFFDDVVGVSVRKNKSVEKITMKVAPRWLPYLETKQIHKSQTIVDRQNCIVTIDVVPNRELDALILSYGDMVEILSPETYREHIKDIVEKTANIYSGVNY